MPSSPLLESARAMQSAFRVRPELTNERGEQAAFGLYRWHTPALESFSLPETDDLVVALHLGGSRRVRAITERGLSRAVSIPGLVTLLPPQRRAAFRTAGSISLVTLHLPQQALPADFVAHSRDNPTDARYFAFRDAYVSASMETLLRAARGSAAPDADYVRKLSEALVAHLTYLDPEATLLEESDAAMLGQLSRHALLALIEARLGSKLSLDELARETGLSRAVFSRAFRQHTGSSLHQYLVQRRIHHARQMLRHTRLDLAHIAQELGFANQSHFAATFKALQNCTPREYREGASSRDRV